MPAELRKKDRAKRQQAPMSLAEVADRLVIPAISIKMPKIYERYLAAFQEKARTQRRINNNAILVILATTQNSQARTPISSGDDSSLALGCENAPRS